MDEPDPATMSDADLRAAFTASVEAMLATVVPVTDSGVSQRLKNTAARLGVYDKDSAVALDTARYDRSRALAAEYLRRGL